MLRARVSGEGFTEFSAEGSNVSEVFRDAEAMLREKVLPGLGAPDFSLEWVPEHKPKIDDDVHRWLNAWRGTPPAGGHSGDGQAQKRLLGQMISEYEQFARDGKALRP
jgi:hypothetical protein